MAAKKGSGFALRTQPNAAQKQGYPHVIAEQSVSPHLVENPRSQKPRVGHPTRQTKTHPPKPRVGHPRCRVPLSEEEVEKAIRKKNEKRRRKYRAVHGKVVDWVDHWIEEGWLFVSIRFKDQTDFYMQFGAKIVTDEIDLRDRREGKFQLLRQYFRSGGFRANSSQPTADPEEPPTRSSRQSSGMAQR